MPGSGDKCRTRILQTEKLEQALTLFSDFKKELNANSFENTQTAANIQQPVYYPECAESFMKYLNNEDVPLHMQKGRDKRQIKHYKRSLLYFGYAMLEKGINPETLKFTDINDVHVGYFCEYILQNKSAKNKTYNNITGALKTFSKYIIGHYNLNVQCQFTKIGKKKVVPKKIIVSMKEFYSLLEIVNQENGWHLEKSGDRKNYYKPWLKLAYKMGLFTGGRGEEVVMMKWNGIRLSPTEEFSHIDVYHYKNNKRNSDKISEEDYEIKRVPINMDLEDILYNLGYDKNKGKDEFIIGPEAQMQRKTMMTLISNSFSHYFKQLGTGENKLFKHLRKTYVTELYIRKHGETYLSTGHEGNEIIEKHYLNDERVMQALRDDFKSYGRIFKKE